MPASTKGRGSRAAVRWTAVSILLASFYGPGASGRVIRSTLEKASQWSYSVAPGPERDDVVVSDTGGGRLIVYRTDGSVVRVVARPGLGDLEFNKPGGIVKIPTGYVMRAGPYRFLMLTGQLVPTSAIELSSDGSPGHRPTIAMDDWTSDGQWIYGYGSVYRPAKGWVTGFLRTELESDGKWQMLKPLPRSAPESDLYRSGEANFAVCGGDVFALRHTQPARLLKLSPPLREMSLAQSDLPMGSNLPRLAGADSTLAWYLALEAASMPVGLVCDGSTLEVLARRPTADGAATWSLSQVRWSDQAVDRSAPLPTKAANIRVVVQEGNLIILEMGHMQGMMRRPLESLLLVEPPG